MSILDSVIRAQQAVSAQQLARQQMQQQQALFPLQQRLQQLQIERAQQQQTIGESQLRAQDLENIVQRSTVLGNLARGARGLSQEEIPGYIKSISPVLGNLGIEGVDAAQITPEVLANFDRVGQALSKMGGNQVQQASYIEGLGFVQQLRSGEVRLKELPEDAKKKVAETTALNSRLAADEERQKTLAKEGAKSLEGFKTELNANAFEARRSIPRINKLLDVLDQVGTGKFQQAKVAFGQLIPGVDPADEEALNAALNDEVFNVLARFKGALSDGEREFAKETTVSMGKTTEGNRLILERMIDRFTDTIDEQQQFKTHLGRGGSLDDFVFTPSEQRPVVDQEEQATEPAQPKRIRINAQTGERIQ